MQWVDDGIVLGARSYGESSVILELFTRHHGRHLGLVRGGRSRRQQPVIQPGNTVHATWSARLDEHLGAYAIEASASRAARLMESREGVAGITLLAALARLMPEREAHEGLYEAIELIADALPEVSVAAPLLVRLELEVLRLLGSVSISPNAPPRERPRISSMSRQSRDAPCRALLASRGRTGSCRCRPSCVARRPSLPAMSPPAFVSPAFFSLATSSSHGAFRCPMPARSSCASSRRRFEIEPPSLYIAGMSKSIFDDWFARDMDPAPMIRWRPPARR